MSSKRRNQVRGNKVAMLFQQPKVMLDPTARVGSQVAESLRQHRKVGRREAKARVVELLRDVGIPEPARRASSFSYQLSGGMAQRVMIAAALSADPELLIADEPTTALDVTVQAQILELLKQKRDELGLSILLITHDLGIVSTMADRVAVMYAGRIVEDGATKDIFERPAAPLHPGAAAGLAAGGRARQAVLDPGQRGAGAGAWSTAAGSCRAVPWPPSWASPTCAGARSRRCTPAASTTTTAGATHPASTRRQDDHHRPSRTVPQTDAGAAAASSSQDVVKHFPAGRGKKVHSVDGVSLEVRKGEVLGLVGESGCGKSTLARTILRAVAADSGHIVFDGQRHHPRQGQGAQGAAPLDAVRLPGPLRRLRPADDACGTSLEAPLRHHGMKEQATSGASGCSAMLERVGLEEAILERRPHECSGGQLQRMVIARALLLEPKFLICDEPTSALDASIRAQILNLLVELKDQLDLTLVLISHDLRVVRYLCDRVAVMYLGQIVEVAPRDELFTSPRHPYTRVLLAASLAEESGESDVVPSSRASRPARSTRPRAAGSTPAARWPRTSVAPTHPVVDQAGEDHTVYLPLLGQR